MVVVCGTGDEEAIGGKDDVVDLFLVAVETGDGFG